MILKPMPVFCDLSECAVEEALEKFFLSYEKTLVSSVASLDTASRLAHKYKLKFLCDTDLPRDAWYIKNEYEGVFSPGA